MNTIPEIAEAEWKVMRVLWSHDAPRPAYDIVQELAASEAWHPRTVKTLLHRLVKKEALGYKRYKNLYLYFPLVTQEACLRAESESFLQKYFGGNLRPMLAHFIEHQRPTPAQIRELKKILDDGRK